MVVGEAMAGQTWLTAFFVASLVVQIKAQSCIWIQFNNTHTFGGRDNPATTVATCQNACQSASGCQGIDWSDISQQGQQCFLLFTREIKYTTDGVTHYDLNCTNSTNGGGSSTNRSQSECETSFDIYQDTSSLGGAPVPEIRDLLTCIKACTGLLTCRGFDFSPSTGCWIHTHASNLTQKFYQPGVTQFCVKKCPEEGIMNCTASPTDVCDKVCFPKWARYENTAGSGGQSFGSSNISNYTGCLETCFKQFNCTGIEWTSVPGSVGNCTYYSTAQQSAMTSTIFKPFVTQYRLISRCGSYCQSYWQQYNNTRFRVLNATNHPYVSTVAECEQHCRQSPNCLIYQVTSSGSFVCTLGRNFYEGSNSSAPNITTYIFRLNCNDTIRLPSTPTPEMSTTTSNVSDSCTWFPFNNVNIFGGTPVGALSLTACQSSCRNTTGCQGIDWTPGNPAGQQCFLSFTQNGKNQANWNVTHYDLVCYSLPASTTPGFTTLTPLTNATTLITVPSTTAKNVTDSCTWIPFNNTNIYGGTAVLASSLAECQGSCRNTSGCQGIDWTPGNPAGQQCFLSFTQNGKNQATWNVTHYDLNCTSTSASSTPGLTTLTILTNATTFITVPITTTKNVTDSCTWIPFNNTNIYGGTAVLASSLAECQGSCRNTSGCQGIDWTPGNPAGQQCFLSFTQNGKNQATWNVTHYDLNCTSTSGSSNTTWSSSITTSAGVPKSTTTGLSASATTTASNTTTGPASCTFVLYNDTIIYGGQENPAPTLADCKAACLASNTCLSIDWSLPNPPGRQCFLHSTQSGKYAATDVEHYDRFCPAGCTWREFPDQIVYGGTGNTAANSLAECQGACLATTNCTGVDWVQNNPPGQRCFTFTTLGQKYPAPNVTHYDFTC